MRSRLDSQKKFFSVLFTSEKKTTSILEIEVISYEKLSENYQKYCSQTQFCAKSASKPK